MVCLLSAVSLFYRKMKQMKQHEELPSHLDHSLSSSRKAAGLCYGPHSASAAPSPSASRAWRGALLQRQPQPISHGDCCAMPPTQCRNPVLFLPHDQLMAAAEIPHVAVYLNLQSCEEVAQALPWPLLPLAWVGLENLTAEFPRVALGRADK